MRNCLTCGGRFEVRRLICPSDGDMLVDEGRPAAESGRTIAGLYHLGNLLGEGGMGVVFEATRRDNGKVVAVKILKEGSLGTEHERAQAERRFQVEAEAAAALDHPGVVRVYDFGRTPEGTSFIAMERLVGATFDELRRAGKLGAPERVLDLFRQVCAVLEAAHGKGIVHRDLKPSNLYLHRESRDTSRVKVLDFGIAKILDRTGDRLTSTGELLGTLLYMAPEQSGGAAASPAMDVYSLGVILYEALTGTLPFAARTPIELLRLHASTPAPALSTLRPDASEELEAVIARCLLKRPEHRFPDAGELARAIRGIPAVRDLKGPVTETRTLRRDASSWVGLVLDDRYEIQEWISPSRFGSDVFRATHLRTGADVAVRLWRTVPGPARDCLIEAYRREAKTMGMRHPNLITVIDLGYTDDCVYVVTELVESISLRTLLERKGSLAAPLAVDLVRGLADAIRALHGKGIISGGMSPEMIRVVSGTGGPERLLIAPLGLAGPRQMNLLVSPVSMVLGDRSFDYISPEQRDGREPDARSDLFSLSLVLLEMLGGSIVGWSASTAPTRAGPDGREGAKEATAVPSLPAFAPSWREFFRKALDTDPAKRFGTDEEFISALPALSAGMGPQPNRG